MTHIGSKVAGRMNVLNLLLALRVQVYQPTTGPLYIWRERSQKHLDLPLDPSHCKYLHFVAIGA